MKRLSRKNIDQLGIITSGLCALHCAALPILLSLGVVGSVTQVGHEVLEWTIILASAILGAWSIYNGLNGHGKVLPQILIGAGALTILLGLVLPAIGHAIMALGGITLLYGHWLNWRHLVVSK